ncbi:Intersectin-1 [Armadillidium nasatum]|uniref:Intersectin-1 n=1 Tax=Armadillidium nasatum TaxID=96803 RepID=A0A5N5TMK7_9CRUS|nr:Intersectin-1 [Armadillidium nasatum]
MQKSPRSPKKKGKKLEVAQVIAPYDATSDNQLSLARGQLVSIRKKTASGWWEGELHARGKSRQVGWFPASYVKIKCGSSRTTPVSMDLSGKDDYPLDITPGSLANALSKNASKGEAKIVAPPPQDPEKVEALYPYTAVNDDELSFEPGDIIFVLDKEDSAWWKGSLRGVIGVFPSNYVQTKSEAKIASAPAVISTSVTSDAEDSLCCKYN